MRHPKTNSSATGSHPHVSSKPPHHGTSYIQNEKDDKKIKVQKKLNILEVFKKSPQVKGKIESLKFLIFYINIFFCL